VYERSVKIVAKGKYYRSKMILYPRPGLCHSYRFIFPAVIVQLAPMTVFVFGLDNVFLFRHLQRYHFEVARSRFLCFWL